ncbi:MAG: YbaB/EbfC family nucleoid-associated protein [Bacillota bacterium]
MLQDTVVAAVNDCMKKIDEETEATMGQFSQGLGGMPGMF